MGPNSITLLRKLINSGDIKTEPDAKIFPWTYSNITEIISTARTKANINPMAQPNHGLRKFFEACLDKVGMDKNKKYQLEGHSSGVRETYTSRDIEELRGLYEQAYRYLDLSETGAVGGEIGDLKASIEKEKARADVLQQKLDDQENRMDAWKKEIKDELFAAAIAYLKGKEQAEHGKEGEER